MDVETQWEIACTVSEIIKKQLYLTGMFAIHNNREKLKELGVTHILGLTDIHYNYENDYIVKHIFMEDKENVDILQYRQEIISFIDDAIKNGGIVLIHCMMGISRSASAVIMYLMHTYNFHYITAYNLVKRKRPIIQPNSGFVNQLQRLQKNH